MCTYVKKKIKANEHICIQGKIFLSTSYTKDLLLPQPDQAGEPLDSWPWEAGGVWWGALGWGTAQKMGLWHEKG